MVSHKKIFIVDDEESIREGLKTYLQFEGYAPIVCATKVHHFAEVIKSVDFELTEEEMKYLDEPYQPHSMVGPLPEGPN